MAVFRPNSLARFVIIALTLVCLSSWFAFRTHSQNNATLNSDSKATAPGVAPGIFLAAVEQFGVGSGQVDLFNVALGGSGGTDIITAASPAIIAVTNSTNEGKPDIDNPLNMLFDTSGDLLIGNGGTTTGNPPDNGSLACIPVGAIATGQNTSTTVSTNIDDPVGIAYDSRDGTVALANNPASAPVQLAEYLLNGIYTAAPSGRNLTAAGYGSFSVVNLPTQPAGTYAIGLTDGLETDPAHNVGKSKIAIITPTSSTTSAETDIIDGAGPNFSVDIPRGLAWDTQNSQLVISNNSAFHKLLSFYTVSPVALVKTVNTGGRNDKVAASPDGHIAVATYTAFGTAQVKVYDNTAARNPVSGPIPFNGTTTSCGSTYIYPQSIVNSLTWLSNTKLLIALQSYNGSIASAQNGLYIFDISATAIPSGFDDISCSAFSAAPKQTGFVHLTNKPLATAYISTIMYADSAGICGGNAPCFTSIQTAIANQLPGGIVDVYGGTYNESVNLNSNVTVNILGNTTINDFTLSAGKLNGGGGGNCGQPASFTLKLATGNWVNNGGIFNPLNGQVVFNGSAAQTIGGATSTTFNNLIISNPAGVSLGNNETVSGTLTLTSGALSVASNTLTLNGAVSFSSGTFNSNAAGTVNYNQSSAGQNIAPGQYDNLTFSNFNKILPSGTINISGVFTPGSATGHTIAGNTVNFNGAAAQTIPAFTYNNLTSSNNGSRTLASSGIIKIAGTYTPGTNSYTTNGSTIDFNGPGAQTVPVFIYNNLTISGSRGNANVTLANGVMQILGAFSPSATNVGYLMTGNTLLFSGTALQTIPAFTYNNLSTANSVALGGNITVLATLSMGGATTFDVSSNNYSITIGGNLSISGGFNPQAGTVIFNGSSAQNAAGGALPIPFGNLTVNNASGVTFGNDASVTGLLTLTNGNISMGGSTLSIGSTSTISRTSGYIIGNLKKTFGGTGAFTFPVGTSVGQYSPIDVVVTAGAGDLSVKANAGTAPASPSLNANKTLQRYWTLNGSGITSNVTWNYLDGDIPATATESAFNILRVSTSGAPVIRYAPNGSTFILDTTNNKFTVKNLSVYSNWTLGEPLAPTAASVNIGGRVVDTNGLGVSNAQVSMVDSNGNVRLSRTSPFGYYSFSDVSVGETYVINVSHKLYEFAPRVVFVSEESSNIDFIVLAK
ncbi:MAG TPA: hypothetical protein VGC76_12505 [Pyrinomonadaceae bacterium]|jgi:hypothetical protein